MLPQKLGLPFGHCWAKRHNQVKVQERKDLLLAVSKENIGIFCQSSLPKQQNWWGVKLRVRAYSWWGLSRGEFSLELEQNPQRSIVYWYPEDQKRSHHHSILHPDEAPGSCRIQRFVSDFLWEGPRTLFDAELLFLDCFSFVPAFPPFL